MSGMRETFEHLAGTLSGLTEPGEIFPCLLEGEDSDFVRLNRNRVRQAGHVRQLELSIDLVEGERHVEGSLNVSGNAERDREALAEMVELLRAQRAHVEPDPHLLLATEVRNSEDVRPDGLPDSAEALDEIARAAEGLDLVGIWSSGPLYRAFANSTGQRNWYESANFNFDWSCHLEGDKAVKANYAGFRWEPAALAEKMATVRHELEVMGRPPKSIEPGHYRVYLAPPALAEILSIVSWGGFGLKAHRTRQTSLLKMAVEGRRLNPAVTLVEDHAGGLAPPFTASGFLKPPRVTLIEGGSYRETLVSPRSGKEYGVPVNADGEFPQSLDMAAGEIPRQAVLERLGTGLYLNNLWYCNYSDRNECRITGMTRFAAFWVEDGDIRAPLNPMRFDESLYRMLGEHLIGLTAEREFLFDTGTYHQRSTDSLHLPGALIEDFAFTL